MNPKIIQILIAPNDAVWQGRLLGLGDDGVVYENETTGWVPSIQPLTAIDKKEAIFGFTEEELTAKEVAEEIQELLRNNECTICVNDDDESFYTMLVTKEDGKEAYSFQL